MDPFRYYDLNESDLTSRFVNCTMEKSVIGRPTTVKDGCQLSATRACCVNPMPLRPILGPSHCISSFDGGSWSVANGEFWDSSPDQHCEVAFDIPPTTRRTRYYSLQSQASSPPSSIHEGSYSVASSKTSSVCGKQSKASPQYCAFCKKNGECPRVYTSHSLHCIGDDGRRVVECRVLRSVLCDTCGATGDLAHTKSHCPKRAQPPIALLLKNTKRQCNGSLRRHAF